MPPLTAAVTAALISAGVGATAAGLIAGAITSLATSFALSGLQRLLSPKPKKSGSALQNSGITQSVRQAIIVRKPVYGEVRRSGGLLYIGMSQANKYLHMVIEVAPHEIAEIGEIWLNDYSITPDHLDSNGNVTTGRYQDVVRIRKYLGTSTQLADSYLVSEIPEWTTSHRLLGIAYIYIRMQWDQDKFPTGVPNVSAWIRGKNVYDPRITSTVYSDNVALILNDYLLDEEFGLGADESEVNQTYFVAAANTSDEFVTVSNYDIEVNSVDASGDTLTLDQEKLYYLRGDKVNILTTGTAPAGLSTGTDYYVIPYQRTDTVRIKLASSYANAMAGVAIDITDIGGGTHTVRKIAEPRYSGALIIDTEQDVGENIKDILSGMAGDLTYSGGLYRMYAGAYQTPTVYFTEDDIVSPISVQTKISNRERFNSVRGVYVSPINSGEPSDYPEVKNSTYIEQDQEKKVKQIDMPVTQRPHTAQRIAKINLELSRQEITWGADFNMSALQVVAGENAFFTFDRYGWNEKVFQVKSWKLSYREQDDTVIPVISMELREISSANYNWNNGEETNVDPSPNTTLPDVYTVAAVTGISISSELIETQSGDYAAKVLMRWNLSSDQFVLNGGYYEIQYKESAETEWRPTYIVPGDFNFSEVTVAAKLNTNYDMRIRAVNSLNVRSGYNSILNYMVGTSGGVGSTEDWGLFSETVSTSEDWGLFSETVSTTEDWGYYT